MLRGCSVVYEWLAAQRVRGAVLLPCVLTFACDPGTFDRPRESASSAAGDVSDARLDGGLDASAGRGATGSPSGGRDAAPPEIETGAGQSDAGQAGSEAPTAGAGDTPGSGAAGESGRGGTAGSVPQAGAPAAPAGAGAAAEGGRGGAAGAAEGGGGSAANGGSGAVPGPSCPTRPRSPADDFCYDFESGVSGPNNGDDFWLWLTPEIPTSAQLSTFEQPAGSGNHALHAAPPLTGPYPSATLGYDTAIITRARADFDFWSNERLANTPEEVVFFRFVPKYDNFDRLIELLYRRGQALLRVESGAEVQLSAAPATDGARSHVTLQIERGDSCRTEVYLDSQLVAAAPAEPCGPQERPFVEFGLVALETPSGPIDASYDDIALRYE